MIVLGVDTASGAGGVALLGKSTSPVARELGERGRHAEEIIPASLAVLEQEGLRWGDVELVAVNEGPGSFTGIRVGISFVLGLGESLGVPTTGVGCLDILARACYDATSPGTGSYIVAAADVRRGEVVEARFRVADRGPVREGDDRLIAIEDAGPAPPPETVLAGDGAESLWRAAPGLVRWNGTGSDRAAATARLGEAARLTNSTRPPEPRYARPADARPRRS
jgi:tRNA threonylcarbamoyladenosine biosynthesis protein TsaB